MVFRIPMIRNRCFAALNVFQFGWFNTEPSQTIEFRALDRWLAGKKYDLSFTASLLDHADENR